MPSAAVREQAAARRQRVVDLRAAGLSFAAIAEKLGGVTPQMAHKLYRQALTPRPNGPVPRPGRRWPPSRVFLAALAEELAGLGSRGGRPDRTLSAAARRVGRRLPRGEPQAAAVAAEALTGAAVLALRLPEGQARRLVAAGLVEGAQPVLAVDQDPVMP
jgi:hypothetical protein